MSLRIHIYKYSNLPKKKLRGGALFYALSVSLIIALLSSSLILYGFYSRTEMQDLQQQDNLRRNAHSGLNLLMSEQTIVGYGEEKKIDLFGHQTDSVKLRREAWGAYNLLNAESFSGKRHYRLTALTGWDRGNENKTALHLADMGKPLSLTGKTEITGHCILPASGVQRAYIEGQGFLGSDLISGTQEKSERFLPKLNDTLLREAEKWMSGNFYQRDSVFPVQFLDGKDSVEQKFTEPAKIIFSGAAISLSNICITGHVLIASSKSILVKASAKLTDVVLAAPKIIFDDDCSNSLQAFASDSIITGGKCTFRYPSVLGLAGRKTSPVISCIILGKENDFGGTIFAGRSEPDPQKRQIIRLLPGTIAEGEIISDDEADLQATLYGELRCYRISLRTASSEYSNHLFNAVINRSKRNTAFVSTALTGLAQNRQTVIRWFR